MPLLPGPSKSGQPTSSSSSARSLWGAVSACLQIRDMHSLFDLVGPPLPQPRSTLDRCPHFPVDAPTSGAEGDEAAVREVLGKPAGPITRRGMASLEEFKALEKGITDLSGLEHATNLEYLDLSYNQIADLTPLAGLTQLTRLDLKDNQIRDLTPLAGLTKLKFLYLDDNRISNLEPLADLKELKRLKLRENMISDLSALSGFTKLTQLGLSKNKISDLTPLAGLTQLEELVLFDNENIKDLSPLTNLNRLRAIGISKHPNLPESEIDKLKKALPACRIVRDYPK